MYNLSILFAMLALVWFYVAAKDFLASVSMPGSPALLTTPDVALTLLTIFLFDIVRPHKPVLKFLIVKSVIFLAFWQVRCSSMQARVVNRFKN